MKKLMTITIACLMLASCKKETTTQPTVAKPSNKTFHLKCILSPGFNHVMKSIYVGYIDQPVYYGNYGFTNGDNHDVLLINDSIINETPFIFEQDISYNTNYDAFVTSGGSGTFLVECEMSAPSMNCQLRIQIWIDGVLINDKNNTIEGNVSHAFSKNIYNTSINPPTWQ
jgi:hypothetical protein